MYILVRNFLYNIQEIFGEIELNCNSEKNKKKLKTLTTVQKKLRIF